MHLIIIKLLLIFLVTLLLASCTTLYQPNSLNIPLLEKKNEGSLIVSTGTNLFEIQSAYAITDNYAIMFNYSKADNGGELSFKQSFGEFAVGYFAPLNNINVVETYLGGGYGKSSNLDKWDLPDNSETTFKSSSTFFRLFAQGNFGVKTDNVELGVAVRASYLHLSELKIQEYSSDISIDGFFIAPVLFLRIGLPPLKLNAQLGFSYSANYPNASFYQPIIMSVGLAMRIGQ